MTQKLKEVAAALVRSDLKDATTRKIVLQRLVGERDLLRKTKEDPLAACLHAAAILVKTSGHLGDDMAAHVQKMVLGLVRIVAQTRKADRTDTGKQSRELNGMALGEMLVQLGFVSEVEVEAAMKVSEGRKLGETLVDMGKMTAEDMDRALVLQRTLAAPLPKTKQETLRLGEILVRRGVVDQKQLDRGHLHQETTGMRLGEALVELKMATWKEIADVVLEQEQEGGATEETGETVLELD